MAEKAGGEEQRWAAEMATAMVSWRVQVIGVQGGVQAAAMRFWPKRDKVTNFVREARKQSLRGPASCAGHPHQSEGPGARVP